MKNAFAGNEEIIPLALGTWVLGGCFWGGTEKKEILKTIHCALDQGIQFIDTAPLYGFGTTEEVVGKALKMYEGRNRVFLCTKFGLSWKDQKIYRDARKKTVIQEAENSLRRLQMDSIDLYQLHWPDPLTPVSETAEALHQLLKEGKIKAVGLSNCTSEDREAFQKHIPIQAIQPPFNLFEREIEKGELSYCLKNKIAVFGYGTLCRGLLTGRMGENPTFRGDDLRSFDPKYKEPLYSNYLACVEALEKWVQQKYRRTVADLAFRWAMDKGVIALWGPQNSKELLDLERIKGWELQAEDFKEIDQILEQYIPKPIGVEFLAPPCNRPL